MVNIDITLEDDTIVIDYDSSSSDRTVRVVGPDSTRIDLDSAPPIERIPVDRIDDSPYSVRSFDVESSPPSLVEHVRKHRAMPTFAVGRRLLDGQCEILDGNRRLIEMREAGLDTAIVHPIDIDDWEALEFWTDDHFPPAEDDGYTGYYDEENQRIALRRMLDEWDESRLRELPELDAALDRHSDLLASDQE